FVPTALVAALLVFSYTGRQAENGWLKSLGTKPLSWWIMTWFIAVAVCLTTVGTFFRGPGWSWVWPWGAHAGWRDGPSYGPHAVRVRSVQLNFSGGVGHFAIQGLPARVETIQTFLSSFRARAPRH